MLHPFHVLSDVCSASFAWLLAERKSRPQGEEGSPPMGVSDYRLGIRCHWRYSRPLSNCLVQSPILHTHWQER